MENVRRRRPNTANDAKIGDNGYNANSTSDLWASEAHDISIGNNGEGVDEGYDFVDFAPLGGKSAKELGSNAVKFVRRYDVDR